MNFVFIDTNDEVGLFMVFVSYNTIIAVDIII